MFSVEDLEVYYGESQILKGVSLNVPANHVVCLLGRNGVGKTTLMKTIIGINKARKGSISLDGKELTGLPPNQRAWAGIGYVPQGRGIFSHLSVYENLLMGFEASGKYKFDQNAVDEMYQLFPRLKRNAQSRGRHFERRPATAVGHRSGAGALSEAAPARRADRRHSAFDYA
jgi:urea transport system ATP-binding protein